jgi:translocation and assembly module TamA
MSPRFLPLLLLCLPLAASGFEFSLEAPDELRPLLQQHLELARAAREQEEAVGDDEVQRLLQQSERSAQALLATEGYFSPTIITSLSGEGSDLRASLAVQPGPRTLVTRVTLRFRGGIEQDERLPRIRTAMLNNLPLREGQPFRQADWAASKQAVLRPLHALRYPAANLQSSDARIEALRHEASIELEIDSGPAFHFGELQIEGLSRYPESIVRNLSSIGVGDAYRQQALFDLQQALSDSGYFTQAQVRIDPDPALADAVPVQVEVVEQKAKRFSFGAGVNTDTGARLRSQWQLRNLLSRGLRLTMDNEFERPSQQGSLTLAWPRSPRGHEYSTSFQHKRENIEGQETRGSTLGARAQQQRGRIETTLGVQYQTESQFISDVLNERNQALTTSYTWTHKAVNRDIYPRRGYILTAQIGGAHELLLSDTSFGRLYMRHTQNLPIGANARLVLRGEAGGVFSNRREGIPTEFLFRAGGDNSVRGYAYQSIGRDASGAVQSVRFLGTASVEYHHFFTRSWGAAVFVDGGDATDQPAQFTPVFGYGAGLRYASPVGPINLDLAWGEATRRLRLHFSLGVSF